MPDSAKLVVTAYVKQESHWAVEASMFSFWKERSRIWINLKLWHCSYWVCVGPIDFIHQKQCLRMNGWKPPILLCTFTLESDGTLLIDLICQLLGLEKCGKKSALMDFKGKNVRTPGAGIFDRPWVTPSFWFWCYDISWSTIGSKRSKGPTTQLRIEGTCHCCYIMRPSFRQFLGFHWKQFFKILLKPYISWRDQPGIRTSIASFISFSEQCIIFWEELRNSHCFVSRTVPQCSRLFQIVAKSSQRWKSEGGAADLQEGVEPSKISHCRVCLCQSQFWQQIT